MRELDGSAKLSIAAGDFYVGIDTSLAMLREFPATSGDCVLVQADGRDLPFHDGPSTLCCCSRS